MALSVMIYHYVSWSFGTVGSEYLIGKLGIYSVSIFYILSGLSLGLVYYGRVNTVTDVGSFLIKRLFRIFPLFWLVLTAALLAAYASSVVSGKVFDFDLYKIFLNYSLLFGFVEPSAYLTTGAWSIGNEMVFYALLPLLFLLCVKSALILPLAMLGSIAIGAYFAVYRLDADVPLAEQWNLYINPFNQLFLFLGGVVLGVYGKLVKIGSAASGALLLLSFSIFYFYPVSGDSIAIVTGKERFALSFSCIAFVAGIYFLNPVFKSIPAKILGFFGASCYSIYLLHPVVAKLLIPLTTKLGFQIYTGYAASAVVTLVASWIVFNHLEKPMMNVGKKVATAFENRGLSPVLP